MSTMIDQDLEVVGIVEDNSPYEWHRDTIRQLRLDASNQVALRWDVNVTTIRDGYTRRLGGNFGGIARFASLLERWLRNGDLALK